MKDYTAIHRLQEMVGSTVDGIVGPSTMKKTMSFFNLSPSQAAHFFGQISVETGKFSVFEENLNYSAPRLVEIFPKYFTTLNASQYSGNPEAIANRVYANRMGNGDELSGDGWKYRGRGLIQLTGKSNYILFSNFIGDSGIIFNPDRVVSTLAPLAAYWFFSENKIWDIAKHGITEEVIKKVTTKINGGLTGLQARKQETERCYSLLKN